MRSRQINNRRLILHLVMMLFMFVPVSLTNLVAEERTITLSNGTKLTANTSFGSPDRFHNDYLRVTEIRPVLGILQEWRINRMVWTIKLVFNDQKARGMMLMLSPLDFADKSIVPIHIEVPSGYYITDNIIMEFFNKSTHPTAWNFLSEPGESWIPFKVQVTSEESAANFTFIQWARVTPKEKSNFLDYEKAVKDRIDKLPKQSILLANGSRLEIKMENGAPLRYADSNIQVDNMGPAFDANDRTKLDPWIWIMTGLIRRLGPCRLEILDTSRDGKRIAEYYIKDNDRWNIVFAEKSRHPEFWKWENESKDEWIVVKVRLTVQSTGEIKEWFESCLINKEIRKAQSQYTH